jgi:hypothetical protein
MKLFFETTFEDYLKSVHRENKHPELNAWRETLPPNLADFPNLIFYGWSGSGKYSQMLLFLEKYSPSRLQIYKQVSIECIKQTFTYLMSDIHFEIDMALLGCNAKLLWHEIYTQIVEIVTARVSRKQNTAVILCKNFHMIHNELLDVFYSYLCQFNNSVAAIHPGGEILLKFVLLTESVGFLPQPILDACRIIPVQRISWSSSPEEKDDDSPMYNLKTKYIMAAATTPDAVPEINKAFDKICREIYEKIVAETAVGGGGGGAPQEHKDPGAHFAESLANLRESIYDMFTYNLDIRQCLWKLLRDLASAAKRGDISLSDESLARIVHRMYAVFQYFNNNYRPIYHIENFLIHIILELQPKTVTDK